MYHQISDKSLKGFKEVCEKEGIKYETEQEYRDSAQNLINFFSTLIEIDQKERTRKKRLETEPKGFALEGEGRNCSLCHRIVFEDNGWYDKWGFKCMNCQSAVDKKKIPGSLCGDWKHEKCITDSSLSYKFGLHTQTIRKLIRQGKIVARQIPNGPNLILRKNNPNITDILNCEQKIKAERAK